MSSAQSRLRRRRPVGGDHDVQLLTGRGHPECTLTVGSASSSPNGGRSLLPLTNIPFSPMVVPVQATICQLCPGAPNVYGGTLSPHRGMFEIVRTRCGGVNMETYRRTAVFGIACALLLTFPVLAHHSTGLFDQSQVILQEGTVNEFEWINPHTLAACRLHRRERQRDDMGVRGRKCQPIDVIGVEPG